MAKTRIKKRVTVDGKVKWVSGNTQQEVMLAASRLLNESTSAQRTLVHTCPKFQPYAEEWISKYHSENKHTTISEYKSILHRHLYPAFGNMAVDEITISVIRQFISGMKKPSEKPYAKKTYREVINVLGMVLESAVDDEYIQKNPARSKRIVIPSNVKTERTPLTPEQWTSVRSSLPTTKNETDRRFVALLMYTGMRRNEVLGLQWSDIDWDNKTITVRRGVTFKGNMPIVSTPKTEAGKRSIPLLTALMPFLEQRKDTRYIIGDSDKPVTESRMKRMWERIERTINVFGKTPHCFRHTFTTMMKRAGIDEKVMMEFGGWDDKRTMENVYIHVQEDDIIKARSQLECAFSVESVTPNVALETAL